MHDFPFEGNVTCGTPPPCNAPTPTAFNFERCDPGTVTFTASGCTTGFTPRWYRASDLSDELSSGTTFTTPSLTTTTDYYLACVKNDDATCKSTGVKVTATIRPALTVTISGPELVCGSDLPVTYTASPSGGTFNLPGGIPSGAVTVNGNQLTISPGTSLASLTFSYSVPASGGNCSGSASKSVTINNGGTRINLSPAALCETQSTTYTDPSGTSGTWSGFGVTDTGTGATFSAAAALTQSGQTAPASVYVFYNQTDGLCARKDSALITINPRPNVVITGPETLCVNNLPAQYTATPAGGAFTFPNGLPGGSVTTNGNVLTLNPGFGITNISFSYRAEASGTGCSATVQKAVVITPSPAPRVNSPTICEGAKATLTVANCAGSVLWSTGVTTPSIEVSPVATTDYTVKCTISGCDSTVTAKVTVKPKPSVTVTATTCDRAGAVFAVAFTATQGATVTADKGTVSGNTITGIAAGETVKIIVTLDGCTDSTTATKNCAPTCQAPTPTGTGAEICAGSSATLTTSGCGVDYTAKWFSAANLATEVGSGNSFVTPVLNQTIDYYLACVKNGDATCKSLGVKVTATVKPKPTIGAIATTAATCGSQATNSDASFTISGLSGGDRYSFATTAVGLAPYASATALSGGIISVSNLPNPGAPSGQTYFVRVYNGTGDCARDTTLLIPFRDCNVSCVKPNAGSNVFICAPTVQVDFADATGQQQWQASAGNAAGSIDATTGLATGLTADGIYAFFLVDKAAGSTCADTVTVLRGSVTLTNITTCDDTLTLPQYTNGVWARASGNAATVTPDGKVSGLTTAGNYAFTLTSGECVATLTVVKPTSCEKVYDLALDKSIDKKLAMLGDDISYTIRVWNEGEGDATGIEVSDPLNAGVQYVAHATAAGNYNPNTKIWTIGSIAVGDTVTLTIAVKVIAQGVWFNTAEISKMNEKDVDSTPGNSVEGEDDIDRECFTVPIILCRGDGAQVELTVPQQYTGVVWFRKKQGGEAVRVATGNVFAASETDLGSYEYTFTSTAGNCPAEGCCPILIVVEDCCPAQICVPFTLKKVRMSAK